ncbi:unnamed protein product, partial [Amoebophrya sp. A120]
AVSPPKNSLPLKLGKPVVFDSTVPHFYSIEKPSASRRSRTMGTKKMNKPAAALTAVALRVDLCGPCAASAVKNRLYKSIGNPLFSVCTA